MWLEGNHYLTIIDTRLPAKILSRARFVCRCSMRGSPCFPHLRPALIAGVQVVSSGLISKWRGITICLWLIDAEALISFASNASKRCPYLASQSKKMGVLGRLSGSKCKIAGWESWVQLRVVASEELDSQSEGSLQRRLYLHGAVVNWNFKVLRIEVSSTTRAMQ